MSWWQHHKHCHSYYYYHIAIDWITRSLLWGQTKPILRYVQANRDWRCVSECCERCPQRLVGISSAPPVSVFQERVQTDASTPRSLQHRSPVVLTAINTHTYCQHENTIVHWAANTTAAVQCVFWRQPDRTLPAVWHWYFYGAPAMVRTEIWLWFSRLFQDKITFFPHFSRHFVHLYVNKNITKLSFKRWNFLYNVFFYSQYRMGLKFSNFELQMLYVMAARKLTNAWVINSVIDICIFQVSNYSFQGVFQSFPYLWSFSRLFTALKISTLNSRTFHTFPGSVRTLPYSISYDSVTLMSSGITTKTKFSRFFVFQWTAQKRESVREIKNKWRVFGKKIIDSGSNVWVI